MAAKQARTSQASSLQALEVVIDSNLILNFALGAHPYHAQTRQFLADCARTNTRLIAPAWWEAEADTALRRMVSAKQLRAGVADAAQQLLDAAPVTVVYEPKARALARQIADTAHQTKVYDASYASLAQARGCQLWTGDERFYNAIKNKLPFVRFIGTYARSDSEETGVVDERVVDEELATESGEKSS